MLQKLSRTKNFLESLVYASQDRVTTEYFINVTTEAQRETLLQLAEENDDWLYSVEAENASIQMI